MPKITYHANKFNKYWGSHLQGTHDLSFSWSELVWSAITVGKKDIYDVFKYNVLSTFEILHKVYMIYTNLSISPNDYIIKTNLYNNLDPSEKRVISYYFGLFFTKLISSRLFKVNWLLHVDTNKTLYSIKFRKGKRSPDLIGLDQRKDWFIFEAKGRIQKDKDAIATAKNQTRNISTINKQLPKSRIVVQTFYKNNNLNLHVEDPEGFNEEAIELNISFKDYFEKYYRPILDMFEGVNQEIQEIEVNENKYHTVYFEQFDITIGINKKLINSNVTNGSFTVFELDEYRNDNNNTFIGKDGILVKCGRRWDNQLMKLEVIERF